VAAPGAVGQQIKVFDDRGAKRVRLEHLGPGSGIEVPPPPGLDAVLEEMAAAVLTIKHALSDLGNQVPPVPFQFKTARKRATKRA
jgi:hypothetical protein